MASKTCNKCKQLLDISKFSKKSDNKDGHHNTCSPCRQSREKEIRKEKREGTFKEHNRSEAAKMGHANSSNNYFAESNSKNKSQAIQAKDVVTGEIKYFNSAIEAKSHGFHNTNISEAISSGKPYKGFIWTKSNIEPKETYIYIHTNNITGMSYIGKTTQYPRRRFRKSDNSYTSYKSCTKFYNALQEYGWSSFSSEILEIVPPDRMHEVQEIESKYIEKYDSINNGYNVVIFSEGLHVFPEDLKQRISEGIKRSYANGRVFIPTNKVHHETIDGVTGKRCTKCNEFKSLTEFGVSPISYDKKQHNCKVCRNHSQQLQRKKNVKPSQKIDYSLRRDAMSKGVLRAYEQNPELKKKISKRMSKPVEGTCIETGISKRYDSALAANVDGFDNRQISRAIATGKPHRGYTWKKV